MIDCKTQITSEDSAMELVHGIKDPELRKCIKLFLRRANRIIKTGKRVLVIVGNPSYSLGYCSNIATIIVRLNNYWKGFMTNPLMAAIYKQEIMKMKTEYLNIRA